MAHAMADSARSVIRRFDRNLQMNIEVKKETERTAFGNGSGIMYEYLLYLFMSLKFSL